MNHQTETEGARLAQLADRLDCFTEEDLRLLTGTSPATIESWRKRGAGPAYILAGNRYLYPRTAVAEYLQGQVRERRATPARGVL